MLEKQITVLKAKIILVEYALEILKEKSSARVIGELAKIGIMCPQNPTEKDLQRVVTQSKTFFAQLGEKKKDFENACKHLATGQKTRVDFEKEIVSLSQYQGYRIDKNTTTVSEYAAIYALAIEAQNKLADGTGKD